MELSKRGGISSWNERGKCGIEAAFVGLLAKASQIWRKHEHTDPSGRHPKAEQTQEPAMMHVLVKALKGKDQETSLKTAREGATHFTQPTVLGLVADVLTEAREAIDRGMGKEGVTHRYVYKGTLLSHERE